MAVTEVFIVWSCWLVSSVRKILGLTSLFQFMVCSCLECGCKGVYYYRLHRVTKSLVDP